MAFEIGFSDFVMNIARDLPVIGFFSVFFATYFTYLVSAGVLYLILKIKRVKEKAFTFLFLSLSSVIAAGFFAPIIRAITLRERPLSIFEGNPLVSLTGTSLPSGHASYLFALACGLFFFNKKWGKWFLGFAVVNAIGRMFIGAHWPTDIILGVFVGIASAFLVKYLIWRYKPEYAEEKNQEHDGAEEDIHLQ